jgi:hypothetical protein
VFVDVISVSAVLYIINFANCYQNGPKKLVKNLRKEEKVKKVITIEKKKEIVQKYESGVRVTDLANMYSMSKSTLFIIKRFVRGALGGSERIMGISIISYGSNSLDLRPT